MASETGRRSALDGDKIKLTKKSSTLRQKFKENDGQFSFNHNWTPRNLHDTFDIIIVIIIIITFDAGNASCRNRPSAAGAVARMKLRKTQTRSRISSKQLRFLHVVSELCSVRQIVPFIYFRELP